MKDGWIGVDLDGTLAHDEPGAPFHPTKVGPPIPEMVNRVKEWLAEGREVRIFTARAAHQGRVDASHKDVIEAIEVWCEEHIGQKLEVSNIKDYRMIALWDDRAVQVIRNTGRPVIQLTQPSAWAVVDDNNDVRFVSRDQCETEVAAEFYSKDGGVVKPLFL